MVNIARSQKVERAETNDAGMTVRYLLPRAGPQKSLLRPRCGLHPPRRGAHRNETRLSSLMSAPWVNNEIEKIKRLRQIDPDLRVSNVFELTPLRCAQDMASYQEGQDFRNEY